MTTGHAVSGIAWGIFWMAVATGCQSGASALVRLLSSDHGAFQLLFFYAVTGICILTPFAMRLPAGSIRRATRLPGLYLGRGLLSYVGMLLSFYAYALLNIADVQSLLFMIPIFTVLMASVFLGEYVGMRGWFAVAVGFVGAVIIIRPGVIPLNLGSVAALASAFAFATANMFIRRLSATESPVLITLAANMVTAPLALIPALFDWRTPEWSNAPAILAMGLLYASAQLTLTYSIRAADARIVQAFNFLRLPWAALFAWILFSELPDLWTWVGAAVIFAAGFFAVGRNRGA